LCAATTQEKQGAPRARRARGTPARHPIAGKSESGSSSILRDRGGCDSPSASDCIRMTLLDGRDLMTGARGVAFAVAALLSMIATATADSVEQWRAEWPKTDFSQCAVNLDEIIPAGVPKGEIPPIDAPRFVLANAVEYLVPTDPVISLVMDGDARAYPLQTLIWHQVVNDVVGGVPVAVTYDPLTNAAIVFDRRIRGRALVFGVTGKLRKSNLVMHDRETKSWWQQFTGEAIAGALTGALLETIPARLESVARFKERAPGGRVLVPD